MSAAAEPRVSLFASTHAYTIRKNVGAEAFPGWVKNELEHLDESAFPGFRALGQASALEENITLMVSATGSIGRCRSCMAGAFLESRAEVWLTVDDDNYADKEVLARAIAAVRATKGIVSVPCWLRQKTARLCLHADREPELVRVGEHDLLEAPGLLSGMGVVAMHRDAVSRVATTVPSFRDENGKNYPAVFLEMIRDGVWIGEDFAFCHRAHDAGVPIHLLPDAWCQHDTIGCFVTVKDGHLCASRVMLDELPKENAAPPP